MRTLRVGVAAIAALSGAGCTTVYSEEVAVEANSGGIVRPDVYRAPPRDAVPPLPDYRSEYRPAVGTGWTNGWNRGGSQRTETARDYYLIDAADGLAQAIGDAPPDFAFRFDGRDAWIWQSNEGEAMIVEPSPYGVIQYYYAPRAAAPYLVRDVYQSYAYEGPDFVASYGQDGRLDQRVPSPRTLDSADRLQARGRAIMAASYQRRWNDGDAASWTIQTFSGFGFGDSYGSGIGRGWSGGWEPRWREHRDWELERELRRERDARRRLEQEARDRADTAERFRQWRRDGRRGSAPTIRRGRNPGGDSFVQPVTPPLIRPEPGAGPIMTPGGGGGGTNRPRPGTDRPRPGMVPPVIAQPTQPTVQPAPVAAGPEVPRVTRRPRPEPGVQVQHGAVSETPLLVPANDDLLREQRDAEAAARAAQIAIEAERGRERTIHLEAERMAREEEERERAERAAAAAAASEQRSREAEQAQAEAQQRAAAQAEAEARERADARERAEARAAAQAEAAAARAAAAAEAAAQAAVEAAEARQQARQSDGSAEENVRPD